MIHKQSPFMHNTPKFSITSLPLESQTRLMFHDLNGEHISHLTSRDNVGSAALKDQEEVGSRIYNNKTVPIFELKRKIQWMKLNPDNHFPVTHYYQKFARGILIGSNNLEVEFQEELDFIGNFQGVFQAGEPSSPNKPYFFYFEGVITDLHIFRVSGFDLTIQEKIQYDGLSDFEGYFKGFVLNRCQSKLEIERNIRQLTNLTRIERKIYEQNHIRTKVREVTEYFVPALVKFVVGRIEAINLEECSALVWGTLSVVVQLNQDITILLKEEWEVQNKTKLNIEFNRQPPMVLPFYDPEEFEATQEESEYEWDDIWQGIHWNVNWDQSNNRMQYSIETKYTAELDNTHSMFYAPFNLAFIKIILCLHSIKVNNKMVLHISICDLHDFNQIQKGKPKEYNPHTFFSELSQEQTKKDYLAIYQKHIDRQSKISAPSFAGEYKIANNRLFLFPYHKRVFINKNTLNNSQTWILGLVNRTTYFSKPEVQSVKTSYQRAIKARQQKTLQNVQVYKVERWHYAHIEVPIYKYPVIDMIRIFVPIVILAAISLLIFGQENGTSNGYTLFSRRISSGCSLLIAYVALIPMIRSSLPPTPSITLIEIVIYLSTIPNFLAIISVYVTGSILYTDFFAKYQPFVDALFVSSFSICIVSLVTLVLTLILYVMKNYRKPFNLSNYEPSGIERACHPIYLEYMSKVKAIRKEYMMQEIPIFYEKLHQQ